MTFAISRCVSSSVTMMIDFVSGIDLDDGVAELRIAAVLARPVVAELEEPVLRFRSCRMVPAPRPPPVALPVPRSRSARTDGLGRAAAARAARQKREQEKRTRMKSGGEEYVSA